MERVSIESPSQPGPTWAGHPPGSTDYRRLLAALFCAGVATFAQLYSLQGVLPQLAEHYRIGAADAALTVSLATTGLAVSVIPWSMVADRVGRVRAMSVSVAAATTLGLLVALAPTYQLLLAGRFVEGVALGGVPAVAIAYLTEEIERRHSARAAGIYVAGTTIGGLLGRVVAGPIAETVHWRMGVLVVAVLCALAAVGFIALAPRPRGFVPSTGGGVVQRLAANLRSPRQLALYAQAFLLMGGFVALYNFLGFRLTAAPFNLPHHLVSLVFLAYLAGTWASSRAGAEATRFGRRRVLLVAVAVMAAGVVMTLSNQLLVVLAGLVVATVGFFGAHAIASGWTAVAAGTGKAQASSLYNLAYYGGSSLVGWFGGVAFDARGWPALAATVLGLTVVAAAIAAVLLRDGPAASLRPGRTGRTATGSATGSIR
ncbi:arabinose efflux permease family protein [Mycolicibacterium tokaiense]|uniref:Arabinose efflux permease family protein n=1 Tax=Mycolicibacterium tokaiense TaxID=39695 RepID=A0A378TGR0_9MYCO|nr:MFS transporter [Mycolicibacterium tokaiense]STZ59981.1 arabinose efflux permease family protein [Mycolicibacterium tokaiense]